MNIPTDPVILLSFVNTQLRDFYPSLEEFCAAADVNEDELRKKLEMIDYAYDSELNQFV